MTYPKPVRLGRFDPMKSGDILDLYIDIAADLVAGEAVASVAFTVNDSTGAAVAGVVGSHSETSARTDFRVTAPAAGSYQLAAVFTIDDGQKITRVAEVLVV